MATPIPPIRRTPALLLLVSLATNACIVPGVEAPPTSGYSAPFQGNGKAISVKDGRSDWSISQGGEKLTSEQALEATGDPEYLARRREAKAFNDKVFAEGNANTVKANVMVYSGALMVLGGLAMNFFLANRLADRPITPGTDVAPESRSARGNAVSESVRWGGLGLAALGIGAIIYGVAGSRGDPPYVAWKTPTALDRPAYVRQSAEAYNEKLGTVAASTQQTAAVSTAVAPGQRAARPAPPSAPAIEPSEPDVDGKGETQ